MSSKYKDSMNKIAMDEDMKNRIIANLKNMQDINDIENKNDIKCINNIKDVNNIKEVDEVKKNKVSSRRLKIVRNLGMYAACFAVVLGGMAIKPFMSVPNLDKSRSESSNIANNDNYSNSVENEDSMDGLEDINGSKSDVNVGHEEKNQSEYSSNQDKKAIIRSIENDGTGRNDGSGDSRYNGNSERENYSMNGEEQSAPGISQVNDNSGSSLEHGNVQDTSSGRNADNNSSDSNNVSLDTQGNKGSIQDKNNEVSGLKSSGISTANIDDNVEGRSAELSFDNLNDLKKKTDFDFKVCEVLENNYSKSEINLILNEIVDITYTNNDNNIEFKTCEGKKDISGLDTYENDKTIKVNDVNFSLKGNGNSVKAVEWYEENMSYSIQSSKGLTSNEAIEIAESLKTFK